MALTKRAHILFDEDSYGWLKERARREGTSIGDVVRGAVEAKRVGDIERKKRAGQALLSATPMPVDDIDAMKREIEAAMFGSAE